MIVYRKIDEAFDFYNIDNKYKKICYDCAEEINNSDTYTEAFNKVYKRLYYNDFSDIRELWNIKNINELFTSNVNPFITNVMILLGYEFHLYNIKKYNLDEQQIIIHKKRVKECFENDLVNRGYKGIRISQMLWAIYFIRVRIIEVGRLQYEFLETIEYESIIKIHIPSGFKLRIEEVISSIELSRQKLINTYSANKLCYKCDSWLLSNKLNRIIDKNTNIHKFYKLFEVLDGEHCTYDILNFVFNLKECDNYNELPEETSLQKLIKNELINGTIFNIGIGTLKGDVFYE